MAGMSFRLAKCRFPDTHFPVVPVVAADPATTGGAPDCYNPSPND